ncbi:MAG: DUF1232 domain-containing protein [Geminicoccaceae bacterium]|nr:DUF1232 domain-containing protein [Geminicoccaceae bacterium]
MSDTDALRPIPYEVPDERTFWNKLGRVLASVPFADRLAAAWYCAVDADTPTYVRAVLLGAVAYFILPTDAIPDFLVGIGFTDDATVLATAIAAVSGHIKDSHREKARAKLAALKTAGRRRLPEDDGPLIEG